MVKFSLKGFYVREKKHSNENQEKEGATKSPINPQLKQEEEKEQNENKTESENKSWYSYLYQFDLKEPPKTADVAVGEDGEEEKPISRFFYFFGYRKKEAKKMVETFRDEEDTMNKLKHSFHKEALIATRETVASTFASIFSVFFSHPFDVIKGQYQLLRYPKTVYNPFFRRRRFIYVLRDTYITKGVGRLYKNLLKSQNESVLQVVSMFWTFQRLHQFFEEHFEIRNPDAANFLAGFFSATIPVMIVHPFNIFRERKDIMRMIKQKHGKPAAASFLKQSKHWRPLHRGLWPMFLHMSFQYGLRFMFFHKFRNQLAQMKTTNDKATDMNPYVTEVDSIINFSNCELLAAGALAAILGDILVHPLDVIRSRLAMTTLLRQQYRFEDTCRQFGQCVKLIFKNERAIAALYAGLTPCIIRSTVNTALQFAVYEKMRDWLRPIFSS